MRRLAVFLVLLFDTQYAGVQAQTATWKFPAQGDVVDANTIDTILLDWTSTLSPTTLRMWCDNVTDSNHPVLASSFFVDSNGPFKYVLTTYEANPSAFPLKCHPELAADPLGSGFDCPVGITWTSNSAQAAKTVSQTQAASSVTVTNLITPSSPSSTASSTSSSSQVSTTGSSTAVSLPQSTTATSSTNQPTTLPTNGPQSLSGATTGSQPSASASPNNTGAIVGGAIGGVALLSFIILALLFLRKYQRGHTTSPKATETSKRGFYSFNSYNKRGPTARTSGVFEKEGDYGAHEKDGTRWTFWGRVPEKEGSPVSRLGHVHELQGKAAWKKTISREGMWVGGQEDHAMHSSPVELPSGSHYVT